MVKYRLSLIICEAIQVPICVRAQHDGGLLGGGNGHHLKVPRQISQRVCDVGDDLAWEALFSIRIDNAECDAVVRIRLHRKVSPVPAVQTTMKGVCA